LAEFELVRILTDRETRTDEYAAAAERAVLGIRAAQAFSFDRPVSPDFLSDTRSLLDAFAAETERKFPFRLESLNRYTFGGVAPQTLNVAMGSSGKGKTLFLIDLACGYLPAGLNVLHVNLELRPRDIMQRFGANLFDRPIQQLREVSADDIEALVRSLAAQSNGARLIVENPKIRSKGYCGREDGASTTGC
jgi:predicted ATP-dependent serine protease